MKHMRVTAATIGVLLVCTTASAVANEVASKAAQKAALAWLALVDAGKYAQSHDGAAPLLKKAVTKEQWDQGLTKVRKPLGAVSSRKLKMAKYATSLPNAPAGEYVVIQYDTSFAKKAGAVETITPMLDKDKKWRVSGYFIK